MPCCENFDAVVLVPVDVAAEPPPPSPTAPNTLLLQLLRPLELLQLLLTSLVVLVLLPLVLMVLPLAVAVLVLSPKSNTDRNICAITDAASLAKGVSIPYTYKAAVPVDERVWRPCGRQ
jgi:hypothetical protein